MNAPRWPLADLEALLRPELDAHPVQIAGQELGATDGRMAAALGITRAAYTRRWKDTGKLLTDDQAEHAATASGRHPAEVWAGWTDAQIAAHELDCAADDCPARFVPVSARERYCSPTCRRRVAMRRYRSTPHGAEVVRAVTRRYYARNAETVKADKRAQRRAANDRRARADRARAQTEVA